jgi:transcriptional regulator with XRE-family HTH domain
MTVQLQVQGGFAMIDSGVRALRCAKGLSRAKLSELSGVPLRTLQDIERGLRRRPQLATRAAIAAALGVPCDTIVWATPSAADCIAEVLSRARLTWEFASPRIAVHTTGKLDEHEQRVFDKLARRIRSRKLVIVHCHPGPGQYAPRARPW